MSEALSLFLTTILALVAILGIGATILLAIVIWDAREHEAELERMHKAAVEVSTQGVYADTEDVA